MKPLRLPTKAVLLDIDDTLVDTTSAMIGAGVVGMAAVWPEQDPQWHEHASVRFRTDPGGFFRRYTAGELDFETMRAHRLAEVGAAHGLPVPSRALEMYEEAFRPAFLARQHRYDDVLPFLRACDEVGIAVGALTNSSEDATLPKLEATCLADRFGALVTRDTLGFGKPDARVFRAACERLGSEPSRTAYIGDEWEADIVGARDAGLHPIWLRRRGDNTPGAPLDVPFITSLAEVSPVVDGLEVPDLGATPSTG
ncbi:haloacid dehalogenase [Flexivirga endophytica]|uniref:Haloacid dehalogenase n=1 Tax=Flexivirga endophytica TaxID=1849103 RepID=A0A916TC66_9MICO|nr:HAD family hydrolase [Flexivirga endophytica]GGB39683.1 haloacid dehalogenase [Flexivirga endophytica]GHB47599.1 haloacid dehalogenase [Flexivirga endophytica]